MGISIDTEKEYSLKTDKMKVKGKSCYVTINEVGRKLGMTMNWYKGAAAVTDTSAPQTFSPDTPAPTTPDPDDTEP